MPSFRGPAGIEVEGLRKFRSDIRKLTGKSPRVVAEVMRDAAGIVARQAAVNAPRGTRPIPQDRRPRKRLYQAYTPLVQGNKAYVRNPLEHAPIKEFRESGTPAEMRGVAPVGRAIESETPDILERLGDDLERAAVSCGWH